MNNPLRPSQIRKAIRPFPTKFTHHRNGAFTAYFAFEGKRDEAAQVYINAIKAAHPTAKIAYQEKTVRAEYLLGWTTTFIVCFFFEEPRTR